MKKGNIRIAAFILLSLIWAPAFGGSKILLSTIGPISLAAIRFWIAAILLTIVRFVIPQKCGKRLRKEDWKLLLLTSIACVLHYVFSNYASLLLNETESSMISSFQAVFTLLASGLLLENLVTPKISFCVGISSIGAVLTMEFGLLRENVLRGYALMIAAIVVWVLYCIYVPKLLQNSSCFWVVYAQCLISAVMLTPAFIFEPVPIQSIGGLQWAVLLFLGILGIAVGFLLNAYGLKQMGPIRVSLVLNGIPIVLLLINMLFQNKEITPVRLLGSIMILLGTILAILDYAKKDQQPI